ncbi:hypothetical protein [Hansschlegelia sp. KR7-227]|uniref:hypothetical protein n=1 Tax=Hansschlegelia sp. KR7-227 TaxID=3400914 RepID=UPI003C01C3D9
MKRSSARASPMDVAKIAPSPRATTRRRRGGSAAVRGLAFALIVVLGPHVGPASAMERPGDWSSAEPRSEAARAAEIERECRRSCGALLRPQCDPQTMNRGETALTCASRVAPLFEDCMNRCRGR